MKNPRVAVVGAGIIGCALAMMLAQKGYRVCVFEKRTKREYLQSANGRSTHLVISNRGWTALRHIGLSDRVKSRALPLHARAIHHKNGASTIQPYHASRQPIFAIQRSVLNLILSSACSDVTNIKIRFGRRCIGVLPKEGRLHLERSKDALTEIEKFDFIFGADGANSTVRSLLAEKAECDVIKRTEAYGYREIPIDKEEAAGWAPDAMHAWPRGAVSFFAFPNLDGTFTGTILAPLEGDDGLARIKDKAGLTQLMTTKLPGAISKLKGIADIAAASTSTLTSIYCSRWEFEGKVALIGDAAHAMVPFLGQGMNAGLEDCTEFISLLDGYGGDLYRAAKDYEASRKENCDAVTNLSADAFWELTERLEDPEYHEIKQIEMKLREIYPAKFKPFYELIAFTSTPYKDIRSEVDKLSRIANRYRVATKGLAAVKESESIEYLKKVVASEELEIA